MGLSCSGGYQRRRVRDALPTVKSAPVTDRTHRRHTTVDQGPSTSTNPGTVAGHAPRPVDATSYRLS
ncbi:MAG: hypothetical protein HIU84_05995 [Acidobacteria bacterium]|nr:hypothetical protein [Acidobacteriota bacterium]